MKLTVFLLFTGLFLVGCYKDEIPVPQHDSGDALEAEVEMGQDYRYQLFYSLKDNQVISSNLKTEWDLAFESADTGWHVTLNTSRGMAVHRSELDYSELTSEAGLNWCWDVSSGNLDSTAIGNWQSDDFLYVIDLGYDPTGTHLGYQKMKITEVNSTSFSIEFCDLAATVPTTILIPKNVDKLFTFYKFSSGPVDIAPPNEDWDLEFTQYTQLFSNPVEPYLVTGVLLNRYNTEAALITDKSFAEITFEDATGLSYSNDLDFIGYKWKTYDYTNQIYTIDPSITYLVRTHEGIYFKLHFIDFYNELGEKGVPTFEMQQL